MKHSRFMKEPVKNENVFGEGEIYKDFGSRQYFNSS